MRRLFELSPVIISLYCVPATFSTFKITVVAADAPMSLMLPLEELLSVISIPTALFEKSTVSVPSPPSILASRVLPINQSFPASP